MRNSDELRDTGLPPDTVIFKLPRDRDNPFAKIREMSGLAMVACI